MSARASTVAWAVQLDPTMTKGTGTITLTFGLILCGCGSEDAFESVYGGSSTLSDGDGEWDTEAGLDCRPIGDEFSQASVSVDCSAAHPRQATEETYVDYAYKGAVEVTGATNEGFTVATPDGCTLTVSAGEGGHALSDLVEGDSVWLDLAAEDLFGPTASPWAEDLLKLQVTVRTAAGEPPALVWYEHRGTPEATSLLGLDVEISVACSRTRSDDCVERETTYQYATTLIGDESVHLSEGRPQMVQAEGRSYRAYLDAAKRTEPSGEHYCADVGPSGSYLLVLLEE